MSKEIGLLLSFAAFAAGLIWFYFAWQVLQRVKRYATQSERWPQAEGYIKSSHAIAKEVRKVLRHVPMIEYNYLIRGKTYTSQRVSFDPDKLIATEVVARYPVNADVKVTYDPLDPNVAVLITGGPPPSTAAYILALIGPFIMIAAGVVILIIYT
jgi:hypothetical protein